MAAYEHSTSTLKALLANPLLDRDRVDSTTEALAETLADQREIDEAIQHGGEVAMSAGGRVAADEDDLERELAGMVADEKARADEEKQSREKEERTRKEREEKRREDESTQKLQGLRKVPETKRVASPERGVERGEMEGDMERRYAEARAKEIAEKERPEADRLDREEGYRGRVAAE